MDLNDRFIILSLWCLTWTLNVGAILKMNKTQIFTMDAALRDHFKCYHSVFLSN